MQTVLQGSGEDRPERLLRYAGIVFLAAVAIHGGDHLRRGIEEQSSQIVIAGTIQALLGVVAVALVIRGHRWGPAFAVGVGFASALLFAAAHLLPTWHGLSDSYLTPGAGAGVTWFSWITAVLEIGADLVFGWAGLNVLLKRPAAERRPA